MSLMKAMTTSRAVTSGRRKLRSRTDVYILMTSSLSTRWRPEGVRIEMHELECPEGTFVLLSLDDARAMAAELIRLAGEG